MAAAGIIRPLGGSTPGGLHLGVYTLVVYTLGVYTISGHRFGSWIAKCLSVKKHYIGPFKQSLSRELKFKVLSLETFFKISAPMTSASRDMI